MNGIKNQKRYGVFIRVSTEAQSSEGDSMEMQENLAKEIVESEGGIIYKTYYEPAVSASKTRLGDRPKMLECLNDIDSGEIDHLIAYRRDRLVRNTEESIIIRRKLKDAGCGITLSARGEQQMDLDDEYSKLIENIRASLDEIESAQISMRVSDTMIDKAKRGEFSGGIVPYGYENKDGYLIPVESEKELIKEVEDLYLKGYGLHSICKWLNGMEVKNLGKRSTIPTKIHQSKNSVDRWTKDNVQTLLFNPTYSGFMKYKSVKNKELEEIIVKSKFIIPIRSEKTQTLINNLKDKKSMKQYSPRRHSTPFLLSGILRCGECGSRYLTRTSQRKNGVRYSYYYCSKKGEADNRKCTHSRVYKKELIEAFVLLKTKEHVSNFINSDVHEIIKKNVSKDESGLMRQLEELEVSINRTNKDFQNIRRLLLDLDTADSAYEMMRDMYQNDQKEILLSLNELNKSKENLELSIVQHKSKVIDVESVIAVAKDFESSIDNVPLNIQKKLIEELFSSIKVYQDGGISTDMVLNMQHGKECPIVPNVISLGVIGEPMATKGITLDNKGENIHQWVYIVNNAVRETFYEFLLSANEEIDTRKKLSKLTGIRMGYLLEFKEKNVVPTLTTLNKMLRSVGSSIEEYVEFLRLNRKILVDVESLELTLTSRVGYRYIE